jgi:uncharacterized LabA/DUF88 family protein
MENENLENGIENKGLVKNNTPLKIAIFIDEANAYHSQKNLGWQIDYLKLKQYFLKLGEISVLNFYTSFQKENEKQTDFLTKIKEYGYNVFSKKLKIIRNNNLFIKKGNLDIELALDAYRLKEKYEQFVLFSGDSNFEYLLKLLKKENKSGIYLGASPERKVSLREPFGAASHAVLTPYITTSLGRNENKFSFRSSLVVIKEYGYVVFSKKLKIIRNGNFFIKKGNVDIELAIDSYRLKDNYDTFVLFSGDSDFEYLLKLLKEENKKIIVFSTAKNISRELIKISDEYHELKKFKEFLEYTIEINN